MPFPAISIRGLGKRYRVNHAVERASYRTLRDSLARAATAPLRRLRGETNGASGEFWALKDVTFDVQPGEVVGIIGRNGAGKSTLLKILSRITSPTTGEVKINGRVGSLLEVGTGFHPELTGRENIYMNGSILGMSRREIARKFHEMVAFAEIERFLDTPVKRYSSGMYVRLAFAVAAHLDPELLVVDEVLAVGDAEFQKKCLGKMHTVAQAGRTVLFVSHNMAAVRALCSRAVLIVAGRVERQGDAADAVAAYHASFETFGRTELSWTDSDAPGNESLRLLGVRVSPLAGEIIDLESGVAIDLDVLCKRELPNLGATIELRTLDDVVVLHHGTLLTSASECLPGHYKARCHLPGALLNCGKYRICLIFGQNKAYLVFRINDVMTFEIAHEASRTTQPRPGIIRPRLRFDARYLAPDPLAPS